MTKLNNIRLIEIPRFRAVSMLLNGGDWPEYINEVNKAKLNRHQRDLVTQAGIDPDEKVPLLPIGAFTDEVDLPQEDPQTQWIKDLLEQDRKSK